MSVKSFEHSQRETSKGSRAISRNKFNAILKAQQLAPQLVEEFGARLRELSDLGMNQTEIARSLAESELTKDDYGNFEILRTAVSEAVRKILTPEEAEERRLDAWRRGLASVPAAMREEGRRKGLEKSHLLKDWKPEEEKILLETAPLHLHPAESRYRGRIDWGHVTAVMHGIQGFRKREANAYKQRYSILRNAGEAQPLGSAADTRSEALEMHEASEHHADNTHSENLRVVS